MPFSNGYWRHEPIPEILHEKRRAKLQILTPPEWWLDETSLPRDHGLRCVYGRSVTVMNDHDQAMSRFANRENIMSYDSQEVILSELLSSCEFKIKLVALLESTFEQS